MIQMPPSSIIFLYTTQTLHIPGDTSQEYLPFLICHRDDLSKDPTLTDQCFHNTVTTHAVQYSHIHKADIHTLYP